MSGEGFEERGTSLTVSVARAAKGCAALEPAANFPQGSSVFPIHMLHGAVAAGVYLIGVQKHFTPDNQVVITKMLDEGGTKWSPPVILTRVSVELHLSNDCSSHDCSSQALRVS